MIILMGKGGAGKDTVSKLLQDVYGIPRVVTYTTRPMRPGEKNGTDYHFVSEEDFLEKEGSGFFAETSKTGRYRYGSPKEAFKEKNAHIVLDPDGVRAVMKVVAPSEPTVFLLDAEEDLLRKRMLKRGDMPDMIEKRLAEDKARFEGADSICSLIICQNDETSAEELALYIASFC